MKKIPLILLLCLLPLASYGSMNGYIAGCNNSASGCSVESNEIGNRDVYATQSDRPIDNIWCYLFTADCSGTLTAAYYYSYTTSSATGTLCVYADDGDDAPDSSDAQIGCTNNSALEAELTTWASANITTGTKSVTNGSKYWVCTGTNDYVWRAVRTTGQSTFYRVLTDPETNMPSDLSGTWTEAADRKHSIYVTIGP